MTRFMLAFLQDGSVDGVAILKPETVRQMETRQFELDPMICGLGITFMEYWMNPVRAIGHGGDTVYFHSDMVLVPDAHVGYFISYNSLGKNIGGGRGEILRAFMNRYFANPGEPKVNVDANTQKSDGRKVSGVYDGTRRAETTFLKLIALLDQFRVSSDKEGILTVEGNKNQSGELKKWKEIAPLVYSEVDGSGENRAFGVTRPALCAKCSPSPRSTKVSAFRGTRAKTFVGVRDWWKLAARAFDRVAVAGRSCNSETISAPALHYEKDRVLYFFSRIVCLGELVFILAPVLRLARD